MAGDPLSPGGGEQNVAIEGQGGKCQFVQTEDERRSKLEQRLPALQVGGAPSHTHRIIARARSPPRLGRKEMSIKDV